jgi:hypothetical protein
MVSDKRLNILPVEYSTNWKAPFFGHDPNDKMGGRFVCKCRFCPTANLSSSSVIFREQSSKQLSLTST